jgi:cation diffusion facilitator family transporter
MQGAPQSHSHVFLGDRHEANERKTWAVIILCGVMMLIEIVGGAVFNSLALIADGLHMSTHAGAMLIAALAYTYARRHATDHRFVFGTGKLGDLAGFTSAIVLAVIALFIGYEAIERFISPVPISFNEAIPIAVVGLLVNIVSAWLLSGDHHGHSHGGHSHGGSGGADAHGPGGADRGGPSPGGADHGLPGHGGSGHDGPGCGEAQYTVAPADTRAKAFAPRAAHARGGHGHAHDDGVHNHTHGAHGSADHAHDHGDHPHGGAAHAHGADGEGLAAHPPHGSEHAGTPAQATLRDNSIRSAYIHVLADAFVSVLAITGLILAKLYGWLWMDPLAGIIGAVVIANWSVTLVRDTAGVLLDVCPDEVTRERVRRTIETDGDQVVDLHLWRLGPGHLAAVVAIATARPRDATFYRARLQSFACLSHITVEVTRADISRA